MKGENILTSTDTAISDGILMHSVLCVIDFTEGSKTALRAAIKIASWWKVRLTVLYTYRLNQPQNVADLSQWRKSIDADASNNFARMTCGLLEDPDLVWEFRSEIGFISDRVGAFLQKNDVDMVVIGFELSTSNKDSFQTMVETLKCPLLIVPNQQ